uniref:Anoctamin n=1 Tax=Macrostomum lignano TaxID=282301 RepID=A0A1I8FF87_9PLAT
NYYFKTFLTRQFRAVKTQIRVQQSRDEAKHFAQYLKKLDEATQKPGQNSRWACSRTGRGRCRLPPGAAGQAAFSISISAVAFLVGDGDWEIAGVTQRPTRFWRKPRYCGGSPPVLKPLGDKRAGGCGCARSHGRGAASSSGQRRGAHLFRSVSATPACSHSPLTTEPICFKRADPAVELIFIAVCKQLKPSAFQRHLRQLLLVCSWSEPLIDALDDRVETLRVQPVVEFAATDGVRAHPGSMHSTVIKHLTEPRPGYRSRAQQDIRLVRQYSLLLAVLLTSVLYRVLAVLQFAQAAAALQGPWQVMRSLSLTLEFCHVTAASGIDPKTCFFVTEAFPGFLVIAVEDAWDGAVHVPGAPLRVQRQQRLRHHPVRGERLLRLRLPLVGPAAPPTTGCRRCQPRRVAAAAGRQLRLPLRQRGALPGHRGRPPAALLAPYFTGLLWGLTWLNVASFATVAGLLTQLSSPLNLFDAIRQTDGDEGRRRRTCWGGTAVLAAAFALASRVAFHEEFPDTDALDGPGAEEDDLARLLPLRQLARDYKSKENVGICRQTDVGICRQKRDVANLLANAQ